MIGMVTGSKTGTYFRFGNDMKKAVAKDSIDILVKESKGSIANINRITSNENAALGIVQSDVLGFLMRSEKPRTKEIAKNLRMIFPFYQEEVHVIANKSIRKFNQLSGKTVVVGPNGSGSWLTAMNLFNLTGVRPAKLLRLSPEEGMLEVLRGRAEAMIYVAGKPVKLFQNLEKLIEKGGDEIQEVHFIPLKNKKLKAEYATAEITDDDYDFVTRDVPTIAVTAVLVTYNFADEENGYAKQRCDEIRAFSKSLASYISELKKTAHPKWKEVDLRADIGIWKRDACSLTGSASSTVEDELLDTLEIKW
jgi:TRAP transporter TAXI family solute receptor